MSQTPSTEEFYDGLAADYHLIYDDRWDEAVARQGQALQRLIRAAAPGANTVLDCSCGIGTQAIGLALQGFAVTGTDVSETSLTRARAEAERLGAELRLARADFRDLTAIGRNFDVVISADNALPHMLDDAELARALTAMTGALSAGGLLIVSTRDYDAALRDRPAIAPPTLIPGPPRRVIVRLHEWDAPDSRLHTVRFLILTKPPSAGWTVAEHLVRFRAVTADELASFAAASGLTQIAWHSATAAGFHQPVMTAIKPGSAGP